MQEIETPLEKSPDRAVNTERYYCKYQKDQQFTYTRILSYLLTTNSPWKQNLGSFRSLFFTSEVCDLSGM